MAKTGAKGSRLRQPYFGLTGNWLTFWISVACSTDMTLFGYDQGVFGGVNVTPNYLQTLGISETGTTLSTITAIYDIGSFFGALFTIWFSERFGRRMTVVVGTTIMSIGAIMQASSYSVAQMLVARIIAGLGNGMNTATAPLWQAETSKASLRGMLVVLEMVCNIFGFMLSNWVTYGMSYAGGSAAWRFPIAFQFIFIFVLFGTVPWLPESPRWLMGKGRIDEAEQIIADLEALPVDDPYIITQSQEIQYNIAAERADAIPWSQLLRGKTNGKGQKTIRRLILGCGAQAMQQFGGINVTSYYLPTVLIQSVGFTQQKAQLLAAVNGVSYLIFGSLGIPVVEKGGRRFLMLFSSFGQFVCYLIITILLWKVSTYPSMSDPEGMKYAEASVAFFFLYYVFFGFGWQGIPWLYPTEINSLGMKTKGAALGTATNWIVNFMVVEITPPGINSLHWKFYIIWTVFNFSFLPIVYLFYPETADRTLEDMDRFFREDGGAPLLVFRDRDAVSRKRPLKYLEHERAEVRRNSSVVSTTQARKAAEAVNGYAAGVERVDPADASPSSGSAIDDIEKMGGRGAKGF